MVENMRKISFILVLFVLMLNVVGCTPKKVPEDKAAASQTTEVKKPSVDTAEDNAAKQVLSDFFMKLFADISVDTYTENTRTGKIPDVIREYIADTTLTEGDGNPEIGIHLPRYISINGMTTIHYNIEMLASDTTKPNITSGFISKSEDTLLYFNKIIVKAKVIPDELFEKWYILQEDNTYNLQEKVDTAYIDEMRLEVRYDAELVKKDGGMKVLRAVESNMKPGLKNRLFRMNSESVTRLSYLDISKTADGTSYNNKEHGEVYEAEKAVITAFFNNLVALDRTRMNLLSYKWKLGYEEVEKYWDALGITQISETAINLVSLDENYERNYPFSSLPLCNNMEKIKGIQNITVTPHPAYSENLKTYLVNFESIVQRTNGITDEDFLYRYDYLVKLSDANGTLIVEKIKLNEYYNVKQVAGGS